MRNFSQKPLHGLSEGTSNNVLLLFFRQGVKTYRVTRYADGQLWIFFRMFHRVQQHFTVHDVHVQVLTTFDGRFVMEVTIHQARQVWFYELRRLYLMRLER
ncbi:Uncharacterised protein [Salmonella enterica subsp. arizonae]|uniref:Uncharacterized protein n=1 Tax=Salmonella enterica subsp. arizonae TaxID=59203 RepID=A0A2X4TFQ8_SALER|nr:Uncharacterised protein [Salmonella enterica subsp. arizonae]